MITTTEELLAAWDAGEPVLSVEMGGLGRDYEQCIQVTAFEIVRWMIANPPEAGWERFDDDRDLWNAYTKECEAAVFAIPGMRELHHSGAQWKAGMSLATYLVRRGYAAAVECERGRLIAVSRQGALR